MPCSTNAQLFLQLPLDVADGKRSGGQGRFYVLHAYSVLNACIVSKADVRLLSPPAQTYLEYDNVLYHTLSEAKFGGKPTDSFWANDSPKRPFMDGSPCGAWAMQGHMAGPVSPERDTGHTC